MKARLPKGMGGGPNNMQHMMKQAQKMQEDMATKQAELEVTEYAASAGGGMVDVTVNGKKEIIALKIKPEIVDPEDIEMLEDMVTAAVNSAMRTAQEAYDSAMGQISGSLNIPGVF